MSDLRIGPLERVHQLDAFGSGADELDRWLHRFARIADGAGTAKTYVLANGDRVLGYYALTPAAVNRHEFPERHAEGMPWCRGKVWLVSQEGGTSGSVTALPV